MPKGGKRPGAGRPKGTRSLEREKVADYIALRIANDIEPMIDTMLERAKEGDTYAFRELFDRAFGKASQIIAGDESAPLVISITKTLAKKYGVNASAGSDSSG